MEMDAAHDASDRFLVGDELIDGQHRRIVSLLGAMDGLETIGEVRGLLMKLYILVREHFFDEEALMEAKGYPAREEHAREHAEVLVEMDLFSKRLFGEPASLSELKSRLKSDLVERLMSQDRLFALFLNGEPSGQEPSA